MPKNIGLISFDNVINILDINITTTNHIIIEFCFVINFEFSLNHSFEKKTCIFLWKVLLQY